LMLLEDVGPKVAASIHSFFSIDDNIKMLMALEAHGVCLENKQKETPKGGNLEGFSFLFTGTLPTLKRSEAEAMVEAQGGKILGTVSAKLNYLVVGEDAGSKLEKAKKLSTIKIISESEFLKLITPVS
jgi:DNA ligase (NAD+)